MYDMGLPTNGINELVRLILWFMITIPIIFTQYRIEEKGRDIFIY